MNKGVARGGQVVFLQQQHAQLIPPLRIAAPGVERDTQLSDRLVRVTEKRDRTGVVSARLHIPRLEFQRFCKRIGRLTEVASAREIDTDRVVPTPVVGRDRDRVLPQR
ncbi:MAG: hypothetical protein GC164_09930 [Phycisphaera sp.]|nr:hypothetical protein [Phycisphaera sp.]